MGQIQLTANDGHQFSAYEGIPAGEVKGSIVLIQEIFGVNPHIRSVVDGYAEEGYYTIAPALFDRIESNVELGYEADDMQKGIKFVTDMKPENTIGDIAAAVNAAKEKYPQGKIATIGYCFGGTMAWLSAASLDLVSCSVCYYGGQIASLADKTPKCPTLLHFGELDAHIPMSDVEKIRQAQPDAEVLVYDGVKHGFNCEARSDYDSVAAKLAKERSLAHLKKYL